MNTELCLHGSQSLPPSLPIPQSQTKYKVIAKWRHRTPSPKCLFPGRIQNQIAQRTHEAPPLPEDPLVVSGWERGHFL
ncbi:rCG47681 [Rattus norvegicus]|uniref:RCG47681 n=1 Tax=Rattus norvegicus TaxID=10116 RepID=A6HZI3_RAT|nr:rCG47681 [Rattus norvegicus]